MTTSHFFKRGLHFVFGVLISRLSGFFREVAMAYFFGKTPITDAFNLAFRIPNLFRQVLGEGMYERALMPPFNRLRQSGKKKEALRYLLKTFLVTQICAALATVGLYWAVPFLTRLMGSGLPAEHLDLAVALGRVLLPYLVLISLATFIGAILRFSDRPFLYGFAPGLQNLLLIALMIFAHQSQGIFSMAWGYLAGSLLFLLAQIPALIAILREKAQPQTEVEEAPIRPAREGSKVLLSASLVKAIDIFDLHMASFFGGGAISALFYARRLVDLPLVLFGKAFSGFPAAKAISDFKAGTPGTSLGKIVILASQSVIVPLLPLTVFCLLYTQEIVQLVFMRGAFDAEDVKAVSLPFTFFALGLIPMALRQTLGEIISATEDNAPLVWVSIPGALLNVIMNIVLVQTPLSYGGIALATTLSYLFQVVLLFRWINRKVERLQGKPLRPLFWRTILGLGLFFLLVWGLKSSITLPHQGWLRLISLMLIGTLSFGFYFLILLPFFIERKRPELKIVLAGGGTGGHVYPGLAILEAIQSSELLLGDIHYLGMKGKPEEAIVGKAGLPFLKIRSAPIAGLHPKTLIKAIWTIGLGTLQSMRHFIRLRPNLIVAGGGYVSAPAVFAGFLLRPYLKCRILVAEQNFMPGLLNKAASLLADAVLVNFKPSAFFLWSNNCVHVGYPVRQALLQNTETPQALRHRLGLSGDRQVLVVYGGSIGAKTINESLLNALPSLLNRHPRLSVIHSFGLNQSQAYHAKNQCLRHLRELFPQENQDEVNDHFVIRDEQGQLRYLGQPFFHDLYDYLKVADVVVSRAGAGALAEIQALGKAALVIPKRGLPGDHQELNAIDLASRGICDVLFEEQPPGNEWPDIPQEELLIRLEALMADDQKRQSYEEKAKASFFESFQRTTIQAVRDVLEQRRLDLISTISEPLLARLHRQEDFLVSHLKTLPKGHLLRRYYSGKIPHLLKSTHYLGVNKGIKLIGALNARTYLDWLFEHFSDFNGFQKRNTLIALNHMDFFDGRVERLIQRALKDRYFETRREAVCLAARHLNRLAQPEIIQQLILERIRDSSESFEVRVEGLKTCVFFLSQREFMEVGQPFLTHRQVRLREGLILALEHALRQNRFDDLKSLRKFAQQVMITTSDYEPVFRIRNHFKSLSQRLEEKR